MSDRGGSRAEMPIVYQQNKYAPRSRSVYVPTLYTDALSARTTENEEKCEHIEACMCHSMDTLHKLRKGRSEEDEFGYTSMKSELNLLSCHPDKSHLVQPTSLTAPITRSNLVDDICALHGAPPCSWNHDHGDDLRLTFDEWRQAKHSESIEAEARAKRQAVAELTLQIARRVQATREYEEWKKEKAKQKREQQLHEAKLEAESKETPEQLSLKAKEREEAFALWRRSKDRALLVSRHHRAEVECQQSASTTQLSHDKRQRAQAAFEEWNRNRTKKLAEERRNHNEMTRAKEIEAKETKEERRARGRELYEEWKKETEAKLKKEKMEELKKEQEVKQAKEKHAQHVLLTQSEREKRLASHFESLLAEQSRKTVAATRADRDAHKLIWQKKENPLAYSTIPRPQKTFR